MIESLVEIELPSKGSPETGDTQEQQRAEFLKIKETLTRIGIASRKENKLYQSCHILHKKGKYYLVHFKEMFLLDGRPANFTTEDKVRRNIIASRLEEWGLCKVVNHSMIENNGETAYVKIIPYRDKGQWELVEKYNVGKFKR